MFGQSVSSHGARGRGAFRFPLVRGGFVLAWLLTAGRASAIQDPATQDPPEAEPLPVAQEFVVEGRSEVLLGVAASASEGRVGQAEIEKRPILRTAEILEVIPGFIATQHSGSGKANQYFLRGFNLDHGTDFSASVEGVPINQPTHGHGQGYLDLNFLIPELVEVVEFRKGPYYADVGDFSSAGHADFQLADRLDQGVFKLGYGENRFGSLLVADSFDTEHGHLLFATAAQLYDGPWDVQENVRRFNGLIKYGEGEDDAGWALSGMFYANEWDATDQIPLRAVRQGRLSEFGAIDPTDGGSSSRYSLNAEWWAGGSDERTEANLYLTRSTLNLFSNFTYFLNDPVNGDQFRQLDRRWTGGFNVEHGWSDAWFGDESFQRVGMQLRNDYIPELALQNSTARRVTSTVRKDRVVQSSLALYADTEIYWSNEFRTTAGLRGDLYRFDVDSRNPANSGSETDAIVTPKLAMAYQPHPEWEFYANGGLGFHSNDARGVTLTVDPVSGLPGMPVDPLVQSQGAEIGLRTTAIEGLQSTVSAWYLELDSELLFVGDAGATEASRPSRRLGVEWANFYQVNDWLTLDADLAFTHAEFSDRQPGGDEIPGSLDLVIAAGASVAFENGFFGSLRLRHFGARPLIEDGSVESDPTSLLNLQFGYAEDDWALYVDVLNLTDSSADDIAYFYESRLPGEPAAGLSDLHFHPVEPMAVRVYWVLFF